MAEMTVGEGAYVMTVTMRKMIEGWEGRFLSAYRDTGGVLTIGYGHTGPDVHDGMTITDAQADVLLGNDLGHAEIVVNRVAKNLNQNRFDALASFTFNVGEGALQHSTLLRLHNEGDFMGAANEFPKWNHDNGVVQPGLTRRRAGERQVYLSGGTATGTTPVSGATTPVLSAGQLSPHFTLKELTHSETADRRGIDNSTDDPKIIQHLTDLANDVLEPIRAQYGAFSPNSAYRSLATNNAVGGARASQHMTGQAADIHIASVSIFDLAVWCAKHLTFDQIILEWTWVHISYVKGGQNRHQLLTINNSTGGGYITGLHGDGKVITTADLPNVATPPAVVKPGFVMPKLSDMQLFLNADPDGIWGPRTQSLMQDYYRKHPG